MVANYLLSSTVVANYLLSSTVVANYLLSSDFLAPYRQADPSWTEGPGHHGPLASHSLVNSNDMQVSICFADMCIRKRSAVFSKASKIGCVPKKGKGGGGGGGT